MCEQAKIINSVKSQKINSKLSLKIFSILIIQIFITTNLLWGQDGLLPDSNVSTVENQYEYLPEYAVLAEEEITRMNLLDNLNSSITNNYYKELEELSDELSIVNTEKEKLNNSIDEKKQNIIVLGEEVNDLTGCLETKQDDLTEAYDTRTNVETLINSLNNHTIIIQENISSLDIELSGLSESLSDKNIQIQTKQGEINNLEENKEVIETDKTEKENQLNSLLTNKTAELDLLETNQTQKIELNNRLIENQTALVNRNQDREDFCRLSRNENRLNEEIEDLDREIDRLSFLKDFSEEHILNLEEDIVDLEEQRDNLAEEIEELEQGGFWDKVSAFFLKIKLDWINTKINFKESSIETTNNNIITFTNMKEATEIEREEDILELQETQETMINLGRSLEVIDADIIYIEEDIVQTGIAIENKQTEIGTCSVNIEELESDIEVKEQEINNVNTSIQELDSIITGENNELTSFNNEFDVLTENYTDKNIEKQKLENDLANNETEITNAQIDLEEVGTDITVCIQAINNLSSDKADKQNQEILLKDDVAGLNVLIADKDAKAQEILEVSGLKTVVEQEIQGLEINESQVSGIEWQDVVTGLLMSFNQERTEVETSSVAATDANEFNFNRNGETVKLEWNYTDGNIKYFTDETGNTIEVNDAGLISAVKDSEGNSIREYEYEISEGTLTKIIVKDNNFTRKYSETGTLESIEANNGEFLVSYDEFGNPETVKSEETETSIGDTEAEQVFSSIIELENLYKNGQENIEVLSLLNFNSASGIEINIETDFLETLGVKQSLNEELNNRLPDVKEEIKILLQDLNVKEEARQAALLEKEGYSIDVGRLGVTLAVLKQESSIYECEIERLENKLTNLLIEIQDYQNLYSEIESEVTEKAARKEVLETEITALKSEINEIKQNFQNNYPDLVLEAKTAYEQIAVNLSNLITEREEKQSGLTIAQDTLKIKDIELEDLKSELESEFTLYAGYRGIFESLILEYYEIDLNDLDIEPEQYLDEKETAITEAYNIEKQRIIDEYDLKTIQEVENATTLKEKFINKSNEDTENLTGFMGNSNDYSEISAGIDSAKTNIINFIQQKGNEQILSITSSYNKAIELLLLFGQDISELETKRDECIFTIEQEMAEDILEINTWAGNLKANVDTLKNSQEIDLGDYEAGINTEINNNIETEQAFIDFEKKQRLLMIDKEEEFQLSYLELENNAKIEIFKVIKETGIKSFEFKAGYKEAQAKITEKQSVRNNILIDIETLNNEIEIIDNNIETKAAEKKEKRDVYDNAINIYYELSGRLGAQADLDRVIEEKQTIIDSINNLTGDINLLDQEVEDLNTALNTLILQRNIAESERQKYENSILSALGDNFNIDANIEIERNGDSISKVYLLDNGQRMEYKISTARAEVNTGYENLIQDINTDYNNRINEINRDIDLLTNSDTLTKINEIKADVAEMAVKTYLNDASINGETIYSASDTGMWSRHYEPSYVFNDINFLNDNSQWFAPVGSWIGQDFGTAGKVITKMRLLPSCRSKGFKIRASHDKENWDVLESGTWPWPRPEKDSQWFDYELNNNTSYRYYSVLIDDNYDYWEYNGIGMQEIEMYENGYYEMPLVDITKDSTVTASGSHTLSSFPENVFDDDANTGWEFRGNLFNFTSQWLKYTLDKPQLVSQYKLVPKSSLFSAMPKDWDFQASNDGSNWMTLDSKSGITTEIWQNTGAEGNIFQIENVTEYKYYRINITDYNGYEKETWSRRNIWAVSQVEDESENSLTDSIESNSHSRSKGNSKIGFIGEFDLMADPFYDWKQMFKTMLDEMKPSKKDSNGNELLYTADQLITVKAQYKDLNQGARNYIDQYITDETTKKTLYCLADQEYARHLEDLRELEQQVLAKQSLLKSTALQNKNVLLADALSQKNDSLNQIATMEANVNTLQSLLKELVICRELKQNLNTQITTKQNTKQLKENQLAGKQTLLTTKQTEKEQKETQEQELKILLAQEQEKEADLKTELLSKSIQLSKLEQEHVLLENEIIQDNSRKDNISRKIAILSSQQIKVSDILAVVEEEYSENQIKLTTTQTEMENTESNLGTAVFALETAEAEKENAMFSYSYQKSQKISIQEVLRIINNDIKNTYINKIENEWQELNFNRLTGTDSFQNNYVDFLETELSLFAQDFDLYMGQIINLGEEGFVEYICSLYETELDKQISDTVKEQWLRTDRKHLSMQEILVLFEEVSKGKCVETNIQNDITGEIETVEGWYDNEDRLIMLINNNGLVVYNYIENDDGNIECIVVKTLDGTTILDKDGNIVNTELYETFDQGVVSTTEDLKYKDEYVNLFNLNDNLVSVYTDKDNNGNLSSSYTVDSTKKDVHIQVYTNGESSALIDGRNRVMTIQRTSGEVVVTENINQNTETNENGEETVGAGTARTVEVTYHTDGKTIKSFKTKDNSIVVMNAEGKVDYIESPDGTRISNIVFEGLNKIVSAKLTSNEQRELYLEQGKIVKEVKPDKTDITYQNGLIDEVIHENGMKEKYSYVINMETKEIEKIFIEKTMPIENGEINIIQGASADEEEPEVSSEMFEYDRNLNLISVRKETGEIYYYEDGQISSLQKADGTIITDVEMDENGGLVNGQIYNQDGYIINIEESGIGSIEDINLNRTTVFEDGRVSQIIEGAKKYKYEYTEGSTIIIDEDTGEEKEYENGELIRFKNINQDEIYFISGVINRIELSDGTVISDIVEDTEGARQDYKLTSVDGKQMFYESNKLVKRIDEDGKEYIYIYEEDRMIIEHEGRGTYYTLDGNLLYSQVEEEESFQHLYDDEGNVTAVLKADDSEVVSYSYNSENELTGVRLDEMRNNVNTIIETAETSINAQTEKMLEDLDTAHLEMEQQILEEEIILLESLEELTENEKQRIQIESIAIEEDLDKREREIIALRDLMQMRKDAGSEIEGWDEFCADIAAKLQEIEDYRTALEQQITVGLNNLEEEYTERKTNIETQAQEALADILIKIGEERERITQSKVTALAGMEEQELEFLENIEHEEKIQVATEYVRRILGRDLGEDEKEALRGVEIGDINEFKTKLTESQEYLDELLRKGKIINSVRAYFEEHPETEISQARIDEVATYLESQTVHFGACIRDTLIMLLEKNSTDEDVVLGNIDKSRLLTELIIEDIKSGVLNTGAMEKEKALNISLDAIKKVSERYGVILQGQGLKENETMLKTGIYEGTIAYIKENHYVLLREVTDTHVTYFDAVLGENGEEKTVLKEEFQESFSGKIISTEKEENTEDLTEQEMQAIKGAGFWSSIFKPAEWLVGAVGKVFDWDFHKKILQKAFDIVKKVGKTVFNIVKGIVMTPFRIVDAIKAGDWKTVLLEVGLVALSFMPVVGQVINTVIGTVAKGLGSVINAVGGFFMAPGATCTLGNGIAGWGQTLITKTAAGRAAAASKGFSWSGVGKNIVNSTRRLVVQGGITAGLEEAGLDPKIARIGGAFLGAGVNGGFVANEMFKFDGFQLQSGIVGLSVQGVREIGASNDWDPALTNVAAVTVGGVVNCSLDSWRAGNALTTETKIVDTDNYFGKIMDNAVISLTGYGVTKLGEELGLNADNANLVAMLGTSLLADDPGSAILNGSRNLYIDHMAEEEGLTSWEASIGLNLTSALFTGVKSQLTREPIIIDEDGNAIYEEENFLDGVVRSVGETTMDLSNIVNPEDINYYNQMSAMTESFMTIGIEETFTNYADVSLRQSGLAQFEKTLQEPWEFGEIDLKIEGEPITKEDLKEITDKLVSDEKVTKTPIGLESIIKEWENNPKIKNEMIKEALTELYGDKNCEKYSYIGSYESFIPTESLFKNPDNFIYNKDDELVRIEDPATGKVYMIGDDGTVYEDDVLKGPASELQMSLMKIAAQKIVLKVFKTDPENKEFKKRDSIETIEVLEFMEQMDINEQQNLAQILKSKYEEKPNFEINVNNSFKQLKTDYGNNLPGIDICAFKQKIVFCTADNERIEMEFSTGVRQDGISFEAQGCNILSAKAMQIFGTDVTIKPTAEASAYIKISMDGDISTVINGNLSLHAETGEDFTSDLSVGIRLESSLTKIDITSSSNVTSTTPQRGYNIGSGLNKTIKQAQGTSTTVLGLSELTEKIGANTYYERYVYKVCPTKGSVEGEGEQVIVPIDKTLKEIESMIELEMINYFSNLSVNSG